MKINNVLKTKLSQASYPKALKQLYDAPKLLYIHGEPLDDLEDKPVLAVVGSRKVSSYGRSITRSLVNSLASKGVVIVSGLAFGVDSIAHEAALEAGARTIAVLPAGLDRIYPSSHTNLAQRIVASGGTLLTEYPPETEPMKFNFVARNRLIAGLADGVLLTEAAQRSGSLHTARFASEQGKTVLAVPGNITSPTSSGTNSLIKVGAMVVTSPSDIMNAMDWYDTQPAAINTSYTPEEQSILNLIREGVSDGVLLLERSSLEPAAFNQALTMLEINGQILSLGNNTWRLN